jgi:hypothetical protein
MILLSLILDSHELDVGGCNTNQNTGLSTAASILNRVFICAAKQQRAALLEQACYRPVRGIQDPVTVLSV